jgi:AraC-like DNA-binding protein
MNSTRPDEALEWMRAAYTDHQPRLHGDPDRFEFEMTTVSAGPLEVARMRHSMGFVAPSAPADGKLIAMSPVEGTRVRLTSGRDEAVAPTMLAPTWAPFTGEWDEVVMETVTLDQARVARHGAELTGLAPDQVVFSGMAPLSPALDSWWHCVRDHVRRHVLGMESPPPLLLTEGFRRLAAAMLVVFPNSTQDLDPRPRETGEPATVRRAVEFIDAHAGDAIDLTQIAEASGIGLRGLQMAFRRHRDQTPTEYLRRVRMESAHRDLRTGDPALGDTVAAVAARWGFIHAGRFAVEYRRVYGCSPSETLRR